MSVGNEILTLQFGHYSNYIGAHWLNIQESGFSYNPNFVPEINNDILYREGVVSNGDISYIPRLLLVDFKKTLGHLESSGDLEQLSETVKWDSERIDNLIESSEHTSNEYLRDVEALENNTIPLLKSSYDLNNSITTWSDYIIQPLHTRSINVINNYQLGVNEDEFNCFYLGVEMWDDVYFQDDYVDKIRLCLEECDNLQGFHVLIDAHNGFSGLSSKCLEYLRDEYGKKSIFSVPSYSYNFQSDGISSRKQDLLYILNILTGMSHFAEFSDIITPVSLYSNVIKQPRVGRTFQNIIYQPDLKYHTSAIIAMALDTISMTYRTRDSFSRMNDLIKAVSMHGRTVASVGLKFPFPMAKNDKLIDILEKWDSKWFDSLTPEVEIDVDNVSVQLVNVRGIDNNSLHRLDYSACGDFNPAYACKTAEEMFNLFFQYSFDYVKTSVKTFSSTVRIPPTYPKIFNEDYNLTYEPDNPWGRLAELRLLASIHSTPDTKNFLQQILIPSRARVIERFASNLGVIPTDFVEMQENIERLISCYSDSSWNL